MDAIQSSTLKELLLPTPPMEEQVRIHKRYTTVQDWLRADQARVRKLRAQNLGLMQDLLSGRVSVSPLPAEKPLSHA